MGKVKEYTSRGSFPDRYETHVVDEKGNRGVGIGNPDKQGKQESIEKAYKDLREKRGHY